MSPADPPRSSRLFGSYTALRFWAIIGMGWTALAAIVAVFAASAALWGHLTRVEYVPAPSGQTGFPSDTEDLAQWVEAADPSGVEAHRTGGGSGGGGGNGRDATPAGAWHTIRLQTEYDHVHAGFFLRGSADRETLRKHYGGPSRDAVRDVLTAWEPDVTTTLLARPDLPAHAGLPNDADADVWGVSYAAMRAGSVHEGTVVWTLVPSGRRVARTDGPQEYAFDLTVEVSEERWADR